MLCDWVKLYLFYRLLRLSAVIKEHDDDDDDDDDEDDNQKDVG